MTTIESIVKKLLLKEPFYGIFLLGLKREFGDMCDTACVYRDGINMALSINQKFWDELPTDDDRLAIIEHELGHILYKHMLAQESYEDKDHFNIAADAEVNSDIPLLHKDPYVHADIWDLADHLGTKVYYDQIPKKNQFKNSSDYNPSDSHKQWKDFKNLSESEKKLIENQIDYQVKNTAEQIQKVCGTIPGQFKEYIANLFKKREPVFNWKAYFRRILGTSIASFLKSTRYKPSFRFKDAPGNIIKFKPKVLVAVDTSGSVSNDELSDFFTEIQHLYKSGVEIDIVEFDTRIHTKFKYKGPTKIQIGGRGGTNAQEVFDLYNSTNMYSSLVMFTDGYLGIDKLKSRNVIWVITSGGARQNYPGKVVYIPNKSNN